MAKNGVIGFYHGTWYVSLTFLGELVKLSQEMVYFALKYGTHYITKWPQYSYLVHFQGEFQFKEGFTNERKKMNKTSDTFGWKKKWSKSSTTHLFQAVRYGVFFFFSGHSKVWDLHNIFITNETVSSCQISVNTIFWFEVLHTRSCI